MLPNAPQNSVPQSPSGADRPDGDGDGDDDDAGPPHWNKPAGVSTPGAVRVDKPTHDVDDDAVTLPLAPSPAHQASKVEGRWGAQHGGEFAVDLATPAEDAQRADHAAAASTEAAAVEAAHTGEPVEAVANLNECLRGELSAVESYELALTAANDLEVVRVLRQLRDHHEQRVLSLRDCIREHGGQPVESSGAWGVFARLVQRGADLFGDRAATRALEEGEAHGLEVYEKQAQDFHPDVRALVERELLPAQRTTHELCKSLQAFVQSA
ncbi:MAG: DUF2383 domain-containing protein [Polyangiaceae bacterium]